jgi:molybdopterin/thiamine biosynthesis adenylyltransferase/proteasome lid subunit RPN8/RPN11
VTTLAFTEQMWSELCQPLALDVETAAVLIARPAEMEGRLTLLVRRILWVPDDAYIRRERLALEIASSGYVPALKAAAEDGAVAIFFHTHPGGNPSPSEYDIAVDEQLRDPFELRTDQPLYASLILGGTAASPRFSGTVFVDGDESPLERVRVVGGRLRLLTRTRSGVDASLFDRQIRAFGRDGQALLSALRAGVVGVGGTGSAVFEQLVRLGVGEITVLDDDLLTATNLPRIHESGMGDLELAKVDVARQAAARIGLGTQVRSIPRRVTDLAAARALTQCDVVFGCTDDNRGRAILSRLAYWYLIPVFDTAFLVDTANEQVRGLFGRVTTVMPGTACLFCRNRIDQAQLAAEALPPDERERMAAEGYVPGLGEPDPSIGTYTTLTGTIAVTELLDRLFGFSGPDAPSELLARLHDRMLSTTRAAPREGHYCADTATWGRGDTEPCLEQLW